jgi:hypothetical protein
MIYKCVNGDCPFKKQCGTYDVSEFSEESEFPTPKFKDNCQYYFPKWGSDEFKQARQIATNISEAILKDANTDAKNKEV